MAAPGLAAPLQGPPPAATPADRYGELDVLLREFVHDGGLVDYFGLRSRGRARLHAALDELRAVRPEDFRRWRPDEREAFWINAYNAFTLELVLDHWPVDSIRDIGSLFRSVFSRRFIPLQHLVPGEEDALSLGEIEHGILAREFPPLFHFAIVCASRSCPELRREAYRGDRLREQLEDQARRFLADPTRNDVRIRRGRLAVSRIFHWARKDFAAFPGGIRGVLRRYGPPALARDPALDTVRLHYRDYDWSLNLWTLPEKEPRR